MLDCLILGDSIAIGTANFRKECASYSIGGYNTWQWNKKFQNSALVANSVIISLGTNDHSGVHTFKELDAMRKKVVADKVFWIMPPCNPKFCKPHINEIVEIIAKNYGDQIIKTSRLQQDGIHPSWAGYKELADSSK